MKIALIEFNKYHDELFPTWIYILNEIYNNKCSIDIITRKENKEKNVLAYCNFKNVKWRVLKKLIFRIMLYSNYVNMYLKKYDILIFNSIEPERIIKIVKRLNRISYAVIHNGIIVQTRESYKELIMNNNMIPIFLSENISKYCFNTKSNYITPYYLGEKPDEERKIEKVLFLIQGNLSFERKDYVSLIKSAKKLKNEGKSEYFKFMILGNKNNLEDYYIFMELIKEESIEEMFEFSNNRLNYYEYYKEASKSDYVLPLIHYTNACYLAYYKYSLSSSISISVGLNKPLVIEKKLSKIYGLDQYSINYESDNLYKGIMKALEINNEEYNNYVTKIKEYKSECLERSINNIKKLVKNY